MKKKEPLLTPEEAAQEIENFVEDIGGAWDWDDFISCRIGDPQLDEIREFCIRVSTLYPVGKKERGYCNEEGRNVLREIAGHLRLGLDLHGHPLRNDDT